ncbi:hypothetical protein BB2000_1575 [Proteus mirabilis BB2000]|nr:hypothetical protein BB2000_1575 [Proteus mirabilis BB2000]
MSKIISFVIFELLGCGYVIRIKALKVNSANTDKYTH